MYGCTRIARLIRSSTAAEKNFSWVCNHGNRGCLVPYWWSKPFQTVKVIAGYRSNLQIHWQTSSSVEKTQTRGVSRVLRWWSFQISPFFSLGWSTLWRIGGYATKVWFIVWAVSSLGLLTNCMHALFLISSDLACRVLSLNYLSPPFLNPVSTSVSCPPFQLPLHHHNAKCMRNSRVQR